MSVELGYYGLDICGCCSDFIVKPQCGHLLHLSESSNSEYILNFEVMFSCPACGYVRFRKLSYIVVVVIS